MNLPLIARNNSTKRANAEPLVMPALPSKFKHVSHAPLSQRVQMVAKQAARAHKRGRRQWLGQLISPHLWQHLQAPKPLDGLSLYRQALSKLVVPPQLNAANAKGKTILLVSRC